MCRILGAQGGRCHYCDRPLPFRHATIDHLQPRSHGGSNRDENVVVACQWCNCARKTQCPAAFKVHVGKLKASGPLPPTNAVDRRAAKRAKRRAARLASPFESVQVAKWPPEKGNQCN